MKPLFTIITLLITNMALASTTIKINDVLKVYDRNDYLGSKGPFEITKAAFKTTVKTEGSKSFFSWEKCYKSRSVNVPRMPFSRKYTYNPFYSVQKTLINSFSNNEIQIDTEQMKEQVEQATFDVKSKSDDSCKVINMNRLYIELTFENGNVETYELLLDFKKNVINTYKHTQNGDIVSVDYSLEGDIEMTLAKLTSPYSI